jgi:hypothetical protein
MKTHAATSGSTSRRRSSSGGPGGRGCRRVATTTTLADSKVRGASAEVALDGEDLVVVGAELHAKAGPGCKVVGDRDGAGRALALTDGPELLEVRGALDGRSVGALVGVDVVDAAVGGDGSLLGGAGAGVVGAEVLDDVVLDQWVFLWKVRN